MPYEDKVFLSDSDWSRKPSVGLSHTDPNRYPINTPEIPYKHVAMNFPECGVLAEQLVRSLNQRSGMRDRNAGPESKRLALNPAEFSCRPHLSLHNNGQFSKLHRHHLLSLDVFTP